MPESLENQIRELAYQKWYDAGQPFIVDDEERNRYWYEAEQEVLTQQDCCCCETEKEEKVKVKLADTKNCAKN